MLCYGRLMAVVCLALQLGGMSPVAADATSYTGAPISLDVQQTEVRDVLRLLATVGSTNIVAGPGVQGVVTARLIDVPWDQALAVILKLHGLVQERHGNVIVVLPQEQARAQLQQRLQAQQLRDWQSPAVTLLVPVQYRDAAELKTILAQQLGACASISVDSRTNTLMLSGTPACLRSGRVP